MRCASILLLLATVLIVGGCASNALDLDAERDAVLAADRGMAGAARGRRDVDEVVSYWSDDGVLVPDGRPAVRGADAIRAFIAESFAIPGFAVRWEPVRVELSEDGTLAWMEGRCWLSTDDETGTNVITEARALTVWRREPDGIWRCVYDIWSDAPPPAAPAPGAGARGRALHRPGAEALRAPARAVASEAGAHTPAAVVAAGQALAYLQLAAEADPDCPQTFLALARLCAGFPSDPGLPPVERNTRIRTAAGRAIELDSRLAEAHVLLGLAEMDDWRWAEAERSLRRAIEIAPDDPAARAALARFLAATGRTAAAVESIERARALAPDDPRLDLEAGAIHHWARDHRRAVELLRPGAEAEVPRAQFLLGWAHVGEGNWAEAASWFERLLPRTDGDAGVLMSLAYVYANFDRRDEVPAMLAEVEERADRMHVPAYRIAATYLALGEPKKALYWLEQAADDDRGRLARVRVDPVFDPLRTEARFVDVLARIGYPTMPVLAAAGEGGWIPLFNGRDLTGWTPKFSGFPLGENHHDTFRVTDGVLEVSYDDYEGFDGTFGHLFHEQPFSSYRLRLEYRFTGEQTPGGARWAFRNSGVMIHGQDPRTMRIDQDFPVSIEVQLLGGDGVNDRPTGNVCTPGTHVVMEDVLERRHCIDSVSATYHHDDWVTLEIEVRGGAVVRHLVYGEVVLEYAQPQLDPNDADAAEWIRRRGGEVLLEEGTIALQAESHPCAFRRIELLPLE